ncbi:MAG: polysaccharide biosynthesis protein [Thermoguttaceae bacterium]|nr:polysaccharide biosynthesis protein [Thermoguttaceae bacterium]MDW8079819.1 nucleoside-diphosphate sugar epimerase/dehydratase [Thermoguttaceae bacterium]
MSSRFFGGQSRLALGGRDLAGLLVLAIVFAVSYWGSFLLRFEFQPGPNELRALKATIGLVVFVKLVAFALVGVHRSWGHLLTFYDLLALVKAATAASCLLVVVDRVVFPARLIPRSIFLLDWGMTLVILGGLKAIVRIAYEGSWRLFLPGDRIPAIIVGANEEGEALLRSIIRSGQAIYEVVGFVDKDARRVGQRIGGVRVLGTLEDACLIADRHGVRELLVAGGSLSGKEIRRLIDESRRLNIAVKVLPSYEQLINNKVVIRPRPVAIEDLLRRKPAELDLDQIREWIDGRVLLVTGSAGSIGSEICRQLLRFRPAVLVAIDRAETGQFFLEQELAPAARHVELHVLLADVLDRGRMSSLFERYRPDIVFHAAAYKHVPLMELHPGEAVKNIVLATKRVADLADRYRTGSFVLISTDKAVNPTSVMGACKRVAELYIQCLKERSDCRWITVRFGNVLDSAGSVVQVFRQQIAAGGPVTVTDPRMTRFFMTIPEAAQLVIEAGAIGRSGEILLLEMGEPIRIVDLAEEMIRLSGLRPGEDIEIQFTGLRPGEKLYEELYAADEQLLPTRHPKVLIAGRAGQIPENFEWNLHKLLQLVDAEPEEIIQALRETVPEYNPQRATLPFAPVVLPADKRQAA